MLWLLPALTFALAQAPADSTVFNGRANQTDVRIPRAEAAVTVDGALDEEVWDQATILTGFSLYQPVDQRPAPDSTEILIWYSPSAMHLGVRAFEPHGAVRATLAERDRVGSDDNVEIHLDTYADRRRAFVFIVNPLGVQADGTKSEGGGFIPGANTGPGQNDLSPDFLWSSKGRVTEWGYEVEIVIPFNSLRYPERGTQDWGIQIVRHVQHSGYEETWTPAVRASASFIGQEGFVRGLTGMEHGQLLEVMPELTSSTLGAPGAGTETRWRYDQNSSIGGNVRLGIGSNFVLNGTVKPDFSQVEADALQIAGDARFALFYAEKRPFFVEGIDQFNVPNTLVYTRTIAQPSGAAKVTGRIASTDVALLAAADDPEASRMSPGERPFIGILRLKRDFAQQSTAGVLVSDREEGSAYNRLAGVDVRHVFGGLYFAQFQFVGSTTRDISGAARSAPMWEAVVDRTGRSFGFHYSLLGVGEQFVATNGFVPRTGFVEPGIANRYSWYGASGALLERYNVFIRANGIWRYDDFFRGGSLLEDEVTFNNSFTLRRGWTIDVNPALRSFAFDPADYEGLFVMVPGPNGPTFEPFRPSDRMPAFGTEVRVSTPQFHRVSATAGMALASDVDFFETSRVRRSRGSASVDWRPTEQIRVNGSFLSDRYIRRSDGVAITTTRIPRLKLEYQLNRAIFLRFVGQYNAVTEEPLIDPQTGYPLARLSSGSMVGAWRSGADDGTANDFRVDWLFSYRPNPGTVFFAGYGSSLAEPEPLRFDGLVKRNDMFFVKASYLLRF